MHTRTRNYFGWCRWAGGALDAGCADYITKPLSTRTFTDDIALHLEAGAGDSGAG